MTEKYGEVVIRDVVLTDAERIREIYDYYVRHTAISFEYETPTREEMRERMHRTMARFPYLAAERCKATPTRGPSRRGRPMTGAASCPFIWRRMPGSAAWGGVSTPPWRSGCGTWGC